MLHRRIVASVLAMLCLAGIAVAQSRPKTQKTPRALAVVEWAPNGQPRLVPITVLIDGRFYNASIYLADPVPLALDTGTVYQVEQGGDATGFFTVTAATQQPSGDWIGVGNYRTNEQIAAAAAAAARKKAPAKQKDAGPPKLKRPGKRNNSSPNTSDSSSSSSDDSSSSQASSTSASSDDRPVLKRPQQEQPADTPDDDDRPRLKRPPTEEPQSSSSSPPTTSTPASPAPAGTSGGSQSAPASSAPASPASPTPEEPSADDGGRPILRRGGGQAEQASSLPVVDVPRGASHIASTPAPVGTSAPASEPKRVLAAISDSAAGEPRSYTWVMKPDDKQHVGNEAQTMAVTALNAYAQAHNGHAGKLEDLDVRMFDLSYTNEPYIILTARAESVAAPPPASRTRAAAAKSPAPVPPARPVTFYVTLVARQDFDGNLRKVYSGVTDTEHLDAWPRLQLVDAVDVNGDGRGELLFRATSDTDSSYIVYGVTPDQMTAIFNSAALQR